MKTIIAEKPSVAREIARIVGATEKREGYITGNGYAVTWAFGHLITLAFPESYGQKGYSRETLPILPQFFSLIPRQVKTNKGYQADSGVLAQLEVINKLFQESESLICATDAGREGELIFRYIYTHLNCTKPFQRLWISSLTDKAIRTGLDNLKNGNEFDNLYQAARTRSESDWMIGINATQAISIAAGRGTYSLGRVQTPTLGMICSRYWENKRFSPQQFWQMHIGMNNGDSVVKANSILKWDKKEEADQTYEFLRSCSNAVIKEVERKETIQEPPLLFDLTSLQKEANKKHGFSADDTLIIAQKLYESKLITYPRTGSRYIPEDVFSELPQLINSLKSHPTFGRCVSTLTVLNKHCVNDSMITDHHALLVTGIKPQKLSENETIIFEMIIGRILESFSTSCIKDVTTLSMECNHILFTMKGSIVRQVGWHSVYKEEVQEEIIIPAWQKGDNIPVQAHSITSGFTKPKPLHTEASLLAAMETAGKELKDEEQRQRLKDCGIGTPATRANIIETLLKREYIIRDKKALIPTEKGLAIHSIVKTMKIADVQMTGEWEAALYKIEHGEISADSFKQKIEAYTTEITAELLSSKVLFAGKEKDGCNCICPKCGQGKMHFYNKVVKCDNPDCGLPIFRNKGGRVLTDTEITELITKRKTSEIKGFKSKATGFFPAILAFDEQFNVKFEFPEKKKRK